MAVLSIDFNNDGTFVQTCLLKSYTQQVQLNHKKIPFLYSFI